jgi:myo-inositol-1(or 4)-monophosphatase
MPLNELDIFIDLYPTLSKTITQDFFTKNFHFHQKLDTSVVTETDEKIESLIVDTIKQHYPDDVIMSEELHPKEALTQKRMWLIDPICGSFNFASGIYYFTTNVALFEDLEPKFAFVVDYPGNSYYWTNAAATRVFNQHDPIPTATGFSGWKMFIVDPAYIYLEAKKPEVIDSFASIYKELVKSNYQVVNFSSSLSMTHAALGRYGGYLCPMAKPWDLACASIFCQKMGGTVTDMLGRPWNLKSTSILGSVNAQIHADILKITSTMWKEE